MQLSSDLREFIALLNSNDVDYLVVGGLAVAFHGAPRFTADLDFLVRPTRENALKVIRAIDEFGMGGVGVTADDLSSPDQIVQLGVKPNRIDLITSVAGLTFEEAWVSRIPGEIDGITTQYIGRDALIRNKEATGRRQDILDADKLKRRAKVSPEKQSRPKPSH
jgi:hypothetical protein